jgi:hypothetical protein
MTPVQVIGGLIAVAGGIVVSLSNGTSTAAVPVGMANLDEVPGKDYVHPDS